MGKRAFSIVIAEKCTAHSTKPAWNLLVHNWFVCWMQELLSNKGVQQGRNKSFVLLPIRNATGIQSKSCWNWVSVLCPDPCKHGKEKFVLTSRRYLGLFLWWVKASALCQPLTLLKPPFSPFLPQSSKIQQFILIQPSKPKPHSILPVGHKTRQKDSWNLSFILTNPDRKGRGGKKNVALIPWFGPFWTPSCFPDISNQDFH